MATLLLQALLGATALCAQPASLLADIATETPFSSGFFDQGLIPMSFAELGGRIYFFADDQIHGHELWVSDGTEAGSHLAFEQCPGSCPGVGLGLATRNGALYFWGGTGSSAGFWRSDGTRAGTTLLFHGQPSGSDSLAVGPFVYFTVSNPTTFQTELWRTDGTSAGTSQLPTPGAPASSNARLLNASPTRLYFSLQDGTNTYVLWSTDGTSTSPVSDVPASQYFAPGALLSDGSLAILQFPTDWSPAVLWRTDATTPGTLALHTFSTSNVTTAAMTTMSGAIYLGYGTELWTSDGSVAGTTPVATIPDNGTILAVPMAVAGTRIFFGAQTNALGRELWTSDGTASGTQLVRDINPGSGSSLLGFPWAPLGVTLPDGHFVFYAGDILHGWEPWVTDGTSAGTAMLGDLAPGAPSSADALSPPGLFNGHVLFRGFDPPRASTIWQTDGTPAGTVPLVQPNQQVSSQPWPFYAGFSRDGAGVVFAADDHVHGLQPWIADSAGTNVHPLADLAPYSFVTLRGEVGGRRIVEGFDGSNYQRALLATDGSSVVPIDLETNGYFEGTYPTNDGLLYLRGDAAGVTLLRTDGTAPGTVAIRTWAGQQAVRVLQDTGFYWIVLTEAYRGPTQVWRSDGTDAGTSFIASLSDGVSCATVQESGTLLLLQGGSSSDSGVIRRVHTSSVVDPVFIFPHSARHCIEGGPGLMFFIDDGSHGIEPWITDGTAAGTTLLADIAPGPSSSWTDSAYGATYGNGHWYFTADDGANGPEPWSTNGTPTATSSLGHLFVERAFFAPQLFVVSGKHAFFIADDNAHGREMWASDGTLSGTHLANDTLPGPGSSEPQDLAAVDGVILFSATDGVEGRELYATDGSPGGTRLVQDIAPGAESSSPTGFAAIGPNVYFYADDATHGFEPWKLPRRALANAVPAALDFYTATPCRLIDTRTSAPLAAGVPITFAAAGQCGIPVSAQAVAVNITAIGATADGAIAIYPADDSGPGPGLAPVVAGRTRATNAILRISLDDTGSLTALAQLPSGAQMDLVVDVSGYFAP